MSAGPGQPHADQPHADQPRGSDLPRDPDSDASHPYGAAGPTARPLHLQPVLLAWVVLGGCAGTAARLGVESLVASPGGWPLPTLVVNLAGAFVLGLLLEALARRGPDAGRRRLVRLVVGTGFCGAFTTYSSFAVDADRLLLDGRWGAAAAYVAVTVLVGLLATAAGIAAASAHHRRSAARVTP